MNKVDSARLRSVVTFLRSKFRNDGAEGESVHRVCDDAVALLDELEASHKTVAPCRFDVAAARAELARIDKGWGNGDVDAGDSFRAARALLDRALAAIDAWRPAVAPVAITDAIVDEAARKAYAVNYIPMTYDDLTPYQERLRRNEARAVLEYAASLGGVAAAHTVSLAPTVDPREERLTRYRCAVANAQVASHETWEALWLRTRAFDSTQTFGEWCAEQCEARAHAMLAAEKEPS